MYDEGSLFTKRLMVPEGTKVPHEKNGLGFGASVGLNCITAETRRPGFVITCVKQCEGHAMDACVNCVLQGGETSAGMQREVDVVREMVRGGGRNAGFRRRKVGERAHMANVGRREVRHRPVNFHRERKRGEGGGGAGGATPWSGATRGGDQCEEGSPSITRTEDPWVPVVGSHRAVVHERTGRSRRSIVL